MSQAATTFDSTVEQFFAGARACLPVAISVAAYGLVWGVLARGAGLSPLEVVLMSGLVFAGSAQFVALDLWTAVPATLPIGPLILAALIVNLRYLLLTATLRPLYPDRKLGRGALSMYLVTDENWAMTVAAMARGGGSVAFLMGGGALAWISWMSTNLIGYGLGSAIDDPTRWGLDFAFTATFLALLLGMWKGKGDLVPWLVAALAAIVTAQYIEGSWHILVGGIAGSFAGALVEVRKHAHIA
ncbi:AzlC family ABC transporter permease [Devosia sp. YIM 151766]|uniref:AzlC family ABC transporter permease n=1 Tax=Devosia sp. YIM 151766 TaxID=3017325 RepID=UPI00255CD4E0|nr:AzlC family ABC transporter permease [Devosia sp. YIM 151766]WIY54409.1 AzlC family ABC transporter permease [Devosia sp. YIM 151766]